MVLEEATSSQEPSPSFSESPPSNDIDTYSGDRNPTVLSTRDPSYAKVISPYPNVEPIYVNINGLPRRFSFFFDKPHPPALLRAINMSCNQAAQMMGRPVRQEEADALAYHFARSVRIGTYGMPVGIAIGTMMAYRGNATFRFPGFTPGEKFQARGFPDVFGPVKGAGARLLWHSLRYNLYGFAGAILGQIFFGSYALTVGSAGRLMDPRLKDLNTAVTQRVKNGKGLPGGREVDATAGPRDGETQGMARQRQRIQRSQKDAGDDMSPTGGTFGDEFAQNTSGDTGMMSDAQVQSREKDQEWLKTEREGERQTAQQSRPRQRQSSGDEPSPTAQGQTPAKQQGGAWERLRQQAASGTPPQQSTRTPQAPAGNTPSSDQSFSFSQSDEDPRLARADAQKEFDARLEREREGKDFEDKPARSGGWRR